jgi:uroporphyrin-III C-methyltransferase
MTDEENLFDPRRPPERVSTKQRASMIAAALMRRPSPEGDEADPDRLKWGRVPVTLVGAGPGDPSLLTGAAREALARAEVVVYDRPSADAVVALARPDATRVCVGRRPGRRALPQEDVNALLVSLGLRGGEVVRLKSGDPFVCSRGGEEAVALRDAGVPLRVVPGVSAALAAPAAAGIPLMVRSLSVTTTIVDGNDDPEHGAPPNWDALAKLGGTLVVLTGRGHIRRIAAKLVAGGLAADTPIAAISGASRESEHVERGTLTSLPRPLPPPVTFVIGEVAALELTRSESPPLKGSDPFSPRHSRGLTP